MYREHLLLLRNPRILTIGVFFSYCVWEAVQVEFKRGVKNARPINIIYELSWLTAARKTVWRARIGQVSSSRTQYFC